MSRSIADDSLPASAAADLTVINGRLWTGIRSQPWAEALASRGERIVALGSKGDERKFIGIIDLQGKINSLDSGPVTERRPLHALRKV